MALVATKPIAQGDELFLDYGNEWEWAWNEYTSAMQDPELYALCGGGESVGNNNDEEKEEEEEEEVCYKDLNDLPQLRAPIYAPKLRHQGQPWAGSASQSAFSSAASTEDTDDFEAANSYYYNEAIGETTEL